MLIFQCIDEDMQALIDNLHNTCVDEIGVDEGEFRYHPMRL